MMFLCAGEQLARNEELVSLTNDEVAVAHQQHSPPAAQIMRTQWAEQPLAKLAAFYALLPGTYRKTDEPGPQTQRVPDERHAEHQMQPSGSEFDKNKPR
jgi:hypothetical protein